MSHPSRLETELSLLHAMYPDQITFYPHRYEVKYTSDAHPGASLVLRLPETYPEGGVPEVISATDGRKGDVRNRVVGRVGEVVGGGGGEVIDAVVGVFEGVVAVAVGEGGDEDQGGGVIGERSEGEEEGVSKNNNNNKTVVVWLHHLLNTNKRKLALNPSSMGPDGAAVSGITKPGYPGILVYSGPGTVVDAHVAELRAQRWQAFQVRLEVEVCWEFGHGEGVVEVESMADVVQDIEEEGCRETFLKAVGIK